MLTMPRVN